MTARSPGSLAALLLCQRLEQTPAAPLKSSEYWALLEAVGDPAALLGLDAATIAGRFGTGTPLAERVATLLGAATGFALRLEEAEQQGLRVVASVDDSYPHALLDRLGRLAPPLLYLVGDPTLLLADRLGIVGSREVGEEAAAVTRQAAAAAAEAGLGVVSGAAKGVDRLAMAAALDAGGTAVGVLADSLVRMTRGPEVRRAVTDGRLCLCTPYKPTAPFSIANAMGRNKLIYALSKATLVVAAAAETGGSWAGAVEAIRQATAPVLVWTGPGAGSGNPLLSQRGGIGVGRLADLFPLPEAPPPRAPRPVTDQLALEV
ncbi:MAG TPA: DNA-processing protein DprA [Actinomycetes bacterium]|jgi:predicted Rossmann fold nucleotide-binding protein DprA/Smf involved in DNA uptake|nr:DNA-processing protein DprA [Actinomycetes bacterium]